MLQEEDEDAVTDGAGDVDAASQLPGVNYLLFVHC